MHIETRSLDDAVAKHACTGVATIDVAGERTLERCEGFRHRALGAPMHADTRIGIASGSKAFTALAVMRLVEDGALRLDQRARELLGDDLPLIDDAVTVEQLLSHTSGIGDYIDEEAGGEVDDFVLRLPAPQRAAGGRRARLPARGGRPRQHPAPAGARGRRRRRLHGRRRPAPLLARARRRPHRAARDLRADGAPAARRAG